MAQQRSEIQEWSRETLRDRKMLNLMKCIRRALGGYGAKTKGGKVK